MSDDILKFRAWDRKTEKYLDTKNLFINSDGKLCEFCKSILHEKCINVEISNIIIEKCTGFRDCKGKYIFEGDIVLNIKNKIQDIFTRQLLMYL